MNIKMIAFTLLTLRLFTAGFLIAVLRKQLRLSRISSFPEVTLLRRILTTLVTIDLVGQFVPILIDVTALLGDTSRAGPSILGVSYAASNALTAIVSSILIWLIYRVSGTDIYSLREGSEAFDESKDG